MNYSTPNMANVFKPPAKLSIFGLPCTVRLIQFIHSQIKALPPITKTGLFMCQNIEMEIEPFE